MPQKGFQTYGVVPIRNASLYGQARIWLNLLPVLRIMFRACETISSSGLTVYALLS